MKELRPVVLVVNDDSAKCHLFQRILGTEFEVRVVQDGEGALQSAAEDPTPDLVLLDVAMPGLNGYEVCQRLKAQPATQGLPIVFLTAMSEDAEEAYGLSLGVVANEVVQP